MLKRKRLNDLTMATLQMFGEKRGQFPGEGRRVYFAHDWS